jgi:hypothetical protein
MTAMADFDRPFGSTVFCDDIRQEVADKHSLMGVYQGILVLPELPAAIPKLGFFITIFEPRDIALARDFPIGVRILFPGNLDQPAMAAELAPFSAETKASLRRQQAPDDADTTPLVRLPLILMMVPCYLPTAGIVRVRADYKGDTIKLGSIRIIAKTELDRLAAEYATALPSP